MLSHRQADQQTDRIDGQRMLKTKVFVKERERFQIIHFPTIEEGKIDRGNLSMTFSNMKVELQKDKGRG